MKEVSTEVEIDASAERVWQVLTDFPSFPEWNPLILGFEGGPGAAARVAVQLKGIKIRLKLLKVEPNRELRWVGHLLTPGIFDGEHYFVIEPMPDGRARLVQGERFTGFLVPLVSLVGLFSRTSRWYDGMNRALKKRVEETDWE